MKTLQGTLLVLGALLVGSASPWSWSGSNSDADNNPRIDLSQYEPLPVPSPLISSSRRKRDLANDLLDAAGSLGVGGSYIKKFKNLINGTPPKMQDAFLNQDFSNITKEDIYALNVTVLEYIPPNLISKMDMSLISPILERLLQSNKPMAMGRTMGAIGDRMDSNQILDKLKEGGGLSDQTEEAGSVMLYSALNKVGDKGGINMQMIRRLLGDGLLGLVPEEQLMKVTDPAAAKQLLNRLYTSPTDTKDMEDLDDQALMYKLAEVGYGKAESWTSETLRNVGQKVTAQMPAEFLKQLNPETVVSSISTLRETKFESPLQAKSVTDVYMEKSGVKNENSDADSFGALNFGSLLTSLGPLAAFVNPSLSKDSSFLNSIVNACDRLNLPAPLRAITDLVRQKTQGGKKITDLGPEDFREMGATVLKNGPPALVDQAMKTNSISEADYKEIGGQTRTEAGQQGGGLFDGAFFQGIIAQVAAGAVKFFTRGGKIDFGGLPGAFLGALGIKGINDVSNRDLDGDILEKLKKNPDALDDAQKAMLLKRLKEAGMLDSVDLPPEIRALQPRKKQDDPRRGDDILDGLPSDAELRLAHGQGKKVTAYDLEKDPYLVGTLTPKQVDQIDLEQIPAILAVIRKSKDGPQPKTLEALSKRFADYVRLKSEDYESPDKKLLKYISAAEVSKLPATVLAYFIDHRQTSKLPPDVRKEIMIAMGELSTKDHSSIPGKTREEIILQGLAALDTMTGVKTIDVPELAAIGSGVADLPPNKIERLTPVAVEQALEVIKGTADDDDDGLKQRACLKPEQRQAWRKRILELYGEPSKWDAATVTTLCCTIGLLNEADLHSIAVDALATCRCPSDAKPPSHLADLKKSLDTTCQHELGGKAEDTKKTMEKVKAEMAFDLDDLESQIVSRKKRHSHHSGDHGDGQLTCFKIRVTGTAAPFTLAQLGTLPQSEMDNCLYELGVDPLPLDHSRLLWRKYKESKGGVNGLSAADLRYAGHVLGGITLADVSGLDFSDWDVVFVFSKSLGLSKNVLEKMASLLEEKQTKPVSQFTSNDLVVSKNILCGFHPDKLMEINPEAFREALPVLKTIDASCEQTRLAALGGLTIRPEVFGDPASWTAADVRGAGILLNGLPPSQVEKIPEEAFMGLTPAVAEAMPEPIVAALSVDSIGYIPRWAAQAYSDEQMSKMSEEASTALKGVIDGPIVSMGIRSQLLSSWTFLTLLLTTLFAHQVL